MRYRASSSVISSFFTLPFQPQSDFSYLDKKYKKPCKTEDVALITLTGNLKNTYISLTLVSSSFKIHSWVSLSRLHQCEPVTKASKPTKLIFKGIDNSSRGSRWKMERGISQSLRQICDTNMPSIYFTFSLAFVTRALDANAFFFSSRNAARRSLPEIFCLF